MNPPITGHVRVSYTVSFPGVEEVEYLDAFEMTAEVLVGEVIEMNKDIDHNPPTKVKHTVDDICMKLAARSAAKTAGDAKIAAHETDPN